MIAALFASLAILCTSVWSLPVTSGHLESEDVKVLKCIVEALADVLSRPRPLPVSQDCLLTLTTDDRLVAILRHQNFLRELQEIALEGSQKRAEDDAQQRTDDSPDRSMLESVGGPGERSMLSQEKRGSGGEAGETEEVQDKRDVPQEERGVQAEERRKERKGSEHSEKRDSVKTTTDEKKDEKKDEKRGDEKRGDEKREEKKAGVKLWSKRTKSTTVQKKAADETKRASYEVEIQHHSKEVTTQEVEASKRRSPEEEELQLIARTATEDDEGSGNKKEGEIESLATIESELESVAQKLHELSRADRGHQRA